MLVVLWGIGELHVVDLMTEKHSYNTQYFLSHILESLLLAVFPDGRKPHPRRLTLHLDNCRVHCLKGSKNAFVETFILRVPHPPSSSELAPSDFWLFRYMKAAVAGQQLPGPEDLLTGIQEFLSEIQRSELEFIFHHWIERGQRVLDNDGDYFHE
jgi:hypothetical protein